MHRSRSGRSAARQSAKRAILATAVRHFSDRAENVTHLRARGVEPLRGIHDEIGAPRASRRPASAWPGSPRASRRVMPGRARTRSRCISAGADSHHHGVAPLARRRSRTAAGCRARDLRAARLRLGEEPRRALRAPADGRSPRAARAQPDRRARARRACRDRPCRRGRAGKRRLDRRRPPRPHRARCTAASASCTGTPASAKNFAVVDLPMPTEPVRPRMNMRSAHRDAGRRVLPQKSSSGSSGRPRMVNSRRRSARTAGCRAFELIGADACGHRRARRRRDSPRGTVGERAHRQPRRLDDARTAPPVAHQRQRRMQLVGSPAQALQLLARRSPIRRLGEPLLRRAPGSDRRRAPAGPACASATATRLFAREQRARLRRRPRRGASLRPRARRFGRHDLDRNAGGARASAPRQRSCDASTSGWRRARAAWSLGHRLPAALGRAAQAPPPRSPRSSGGSRR